METWKGTKYNIYLWISVEVVTENIRDETMDTSQSAQSVEETKKDPEPEGKEEQENEERLRVSEGGESVQD